MKPPRPQEGETCSASGPVNLGRPAGPGLAPPPRPLPLSRGWGPSHAASACPGNADSSRGSLTASCKATAPPTSAPAATLSSVQALWASAAAPRHFQACLTSLPTTPNLEPSGDAHYSQEGAPTPQSGLQNTAGRLPPGGAPAHPHPHLPMGGASSPGPLLGLPGTKLGVGGEPMSGRQI